jgi:hypothetical protein
MKAFPSTEPIYRENVIGIKQSNGMDLRDYFACHAMQAIISNSDKFSIHYEEIDNWVGNYAYKVADAMMEARNDNK